MAEISLDTLPNEVLEVAYNEGLIKFLYIDKAIEFNEIEYPVFLNGQFKINYN